MKTPRRYTRTVQAGTVAIGGQAPVAIQSMTTTDTEDVQNTVAQINELVQAGCDIVRVAVPHIRSAKAIGDIRREISVPLVADIHFDYRLALEALRQGVDKVRINPGNIRKREKVEDIVKLARDQGAAIRIGVNSGSIRPRDRDGVPEGNDNLVDIMVSSVLSYCDEFESWGFQDTVLSLKTAEPLTTVEAYRKTAPLCDYPLHIGVTSAGSGNSGIVKSATALGSLLMEGIGDTIRVSLTGSPIPEAGAARDILKAAGCYKSGVEIVSCPTCGRCQIDLSAIYEAVEQATASIRKHIKVAVMGCVVNGPGEAADADLGIAGGKGFGYVFKKGKKLRRVPEAELADALIEEIKKETGDE